MALTAGLAEAARKAVALDDGDATAHTVLAIYEMFSGRHEEARRRFAHGYVGVSHPSRARPTRSCFCSTFCTLPLYRRKKQRHCGQALDL
jgi:hypothetical protein